MPTAQSLPTPEDPGCNILAEQKMQKKRKEAGNGQAQGRPLVSLNVMLGKHVVSSNQWSSCGEPVSVLFLTKQPSSVAR